MTFRSTPVPPPSAVPTPASPFVQRLAILGLGLIGGSVGLACRMRGVAKDVWGTDQESSHCEHAVNLGLVDRAFPDPKAAVEGADVVVLAVPVGAIALTIEQISPHLDRGAVVTDVGSVKVPVAAAMERLLPNGNGVPGHPIAGREQSGPGAASAEIFVGAKCVLTPGPRTDPIAVERVRGLWKAMGSDVLEMSPERHDTIFAAVSHLPHIVAYALMSAILDLSDDGENLRAFAAGGLRDFTRVAMSHPTMWRDICLANRTNILAMIRRFHDALRQLEGMISAEDGAGLHRQFERARAWRAAVEGGKDAGGGTRGAP